MKASFLLLSSIKKSRFILFIIYINEINRQFPICFEKGAIMYTLMIVDDEYYVRQGIIEGVPFQELGISKVLEASDGIEALKISGKTHIDIIISDVRMAKMDGLEMAGEIRKRNPDCVLIFMSGYTDMEYLKTAITVQAFRFIDKPIVLDDLIANVEAAVETCEAISRRSEIILETQRRDLSKAFLTPCRNEARLHSQLKSAKFWQYRSSISVAVIIRLFSDEEDDDLQAEHMRLETKRTIERISVKYGAPCLQCFHDAKTFVIHFFFPNENQIEKCTQILRRILQTIEDELKKVKHYVAIGSFANHVLQLYDSYMNAVLASQRNFIEGVYSIAWYAGEIFSTEFHGTDYIERFSESLKTDYDTAASVINELCTACKLTGNILPSQVKNIYLKLLLKLMVAFESYRLDMLFTSTDEQNIWDVITGTKSLDDLTSFTLECVAQFFDEFEASSYNDIVCRIEECIDKRFRDPNLSLDMLSDVLGLTSSYICLIFKRQRDMTINQFITKLRIEYGKTLLSKKRYKISEIAKLSGYPDNNYFTKVFKKSVGLTPTEYREGFFL